MDKLKDFIDTNREAFDDDLLPEGHFGRFEQKLAAPRRNRAALYRLCVFAAAACIALLFLFRLPDGTPVHLPDEWAEAEDAKCAAMQEEVEGLQLYYRMQMNDVISRMQEIHKRQPLPGTKELLEETQRVLADSHTFEETVLPSLPCSDTGLCAMNLHYRASLESLNTMLEQMENMEVTNKINH